MLTQGRWGAGDTRTLYCFCNSSIHPQLSPNLKLTFMAGMRNGVTMGGKSNEESQPNDHNVRNSAP